MVESDTSRRITFVSCYDTRLGEDYVKSFLDGASVVGANDITSERLWNVGYSSTPILDGLMQLAAIKSVVYSSDRDVVVVHSLWDCFVGKPDYMPTVVSMWRFLYKAMREAGINKIIFVQLVDGTRTSDPKQREYWKFYTSVMDSIKTHWRRNVMVLDEDIINNINKWNENVQPLVLP